MEMYSELYIRHDDPEALYVALSALSFKGPRVNAVLEKKDKGILVKIEAKDVTAVRTALNSYLRILKAVEEVDKHVFGRGDRGVSEEGKRA